MDRTSPGYHIYPSNLPCLLRVAFSRGIYQFDYLSPVHKRTVPISTGGVGRVPGYIFGSRIVEETLPPCERYAYRRGTSYIYPLRTKGSVYTEGYAFDIETPPYP
jgi:hypothetical protein